MLHRMALRVLPSLSLAVTEDSVRKQKRLVMFVPGLVAFAVYRVAKHVLPLDGADRVAGGERSGGDGDSAVSLSRWTSYFVEVIRTRGWEPSPDLAWPAGSAFVYGIQFSLWCLALLWLVGYDYLQHPDGPAMMAIIISSTAVARDAFEIGHVRKVAVLGRPFLTFPDGAALRTLVGHHAMELGPWVAVGLVVGAWGCPGASSSRRSGERRWFS